MIGALGLLLIIVSIILLVVGLFKKSPGLKSKAFKGFGLGVVLLIVGGFMTDSSSTLKQQATAPTATTQAQPKQEEKKDIPREYKMALKAAEQYLSTMPFSKEGLYQQLSSQAGSKFPPEAARYAVENVKTDWNKNALEAAKNYLKIMPMSNADLHQQLTSSAGDKYTKEQADYAISHLPK